MKSNVSDFDKSPGTEQPVLTPTQKPQPHKNRSHSWKVWVGIAISVIMLYLTFKDMSFTEIWKTLKSANYIWIIPVIVINCGSYFIRSYRWRYFFAPGTNLRFYSLFSATVIGFFANNVLPARMGEVIRAYLVAKKEHISGTMSFATIVVERIFDFLTMLMIFGIFAAYNAMYPTKEGFQFPDLVVWTGLATLGISVIALIVLALIRFKKEFVIAIVSKLVTPISVSLKDRLVRMVASFSDGLIIISHWQRIVMSFVLSFMIWIGFIISCHCMYLSLNMHLPLSASILLLILLSFAVAVPSAPGFIGTFHYAANMALELVGVQAASGAFAILMHAVSYIPVTVFGFIFLMSENLKLGEITKSAGAMQEEVALFDDTTS